MLSNKKSFYSNLNIEKVSNSDCKHAIKVWGYFNLKNIGNHHDMHARHDTLLLTDILDNFRDTFQKTFKLDPANFFPEPGLA